MFIPQTKDSEEGKTGEGEPENGKHTNETQEASEPAGMSQKNNDRVRIGYRRYKIRRF